MLAEPPDLWLRWGTLVTAAGAVVSAVATGILAYLAKGGIAQLRIAVEQLDIAKKDVRLRSERDAKSAALVQCERFRKEIIPANSALLNLIAQSQVQAFATETDRLSFNPDDKDLLRRSRDWTASVPQDVSNAMIGVLNMLETWAMTFNVGIADASIAYKPTSDVFCRAVVRNYPVLMFLRGTRERDLFSNVQQLYGDWNGRKAAKELERQERTLSLQLEEVRKQPKPGEHPKPIGTDI